VKKLVYRKAKCENGNIAGIGHRTLGFGDFNVAGSWYPECEDLAELPTILSFRDLIRNPVLIASLPTLFNQSPEPRAQSLLQKMDVMDDLEEADLPTPKTTGFKQYRPFSV